MKVEIASISFRGLLILFKLTLDLTYIYFIYPTFGYAGFDLSVDILTYLESWALFLFFAGLINHLLEKPSDFLVFLFFLITMIPMLSLYGLSEQDRLYTYMASLVFLIIIAVQRGPYLKVPYVKNGTGVVVFLSLLIIGISFVKMITSGSIFRINFDVSKVYDFREEVGDTLYTGLWAYILPWMSKVFTIILLAYALLKKRYIVAIALIFLQILIFGITSHKGVAVYPIFAVGLYMFRNSKNIMLYITALLNFLLMICVAVFFIFDSALLPSLLIRRVFFVPALLKYNYYEYFSTNGYVYWSNSVFSSFIDYPYRLPPVNLIGSTFYGQPDMAANTGFIATSFMHFGFAGMLLFGLIVALLLKLTDAFSTGDKPTWFYLSFLSVPFFGLFANAALLTTLLTHGLGIAILMAWVSYNKNGTPNYNPLFRKKAPLNSLSE